MNNGFVFNKNCCDCLGQAVGLFAMASVNCQWQTTLQQTTQNIDCIEKFLVTRAFLLDIRHFFISYSMKFAHLSSTRSNEMIEEQQPDDETRATTMEDDNYFDSYEDIEVRSCFDSFFLKISPSCCVFNQCKISILVADKTPEILT